MPATATTPVRAGAMRTIALPPLQLRAEVGPASVDVASRTADLVFATGAPVQRVDSTEQRYMERLSLKPGHVRLGRLNNGAPVLNAHSSASLHDVIGVVVGGSARLEQGQGRARVRFSRRAAVEPVWQDVQDGILRNVSVGYRVHKYEETEGRGTMLVRHAVDWEPYEVSVVPIGADVAAQIRSAHAIRAARTAPAACVRIGVDKYSEVPSEEERRAFAAAVEISARLGVAFTSERDVAVSWFRRNDSRTVLGHTHRLGRECAVAVGMSEEETVETVGHELCHAAQGQAGRTESEEYLEREADVFGKLVAAVWRLEQRERHPQPRAAIAAGPR